MQKKILFVDDDRILLRLAQEKFKPYAKQFTIITAGDGLQAIEKLKQENISLVITDLQMPGMDGFGLLASLSENFPDIPVIILTAYGSQTSKKAALEGGANGFMEKPFVVEKLAQKIIEALKKESEGGILQTVPLEMFLQLIEMEQKTCTLRVLNKSSGTSGILFFMNGILMDARIKDIKGMVAAYEIFSWERVMLSIQDTCAVTKKQIKEDLQAILMEAMRLKDEAGGSQEPEREFEGADDEAPPPESATEAQAAAVAPDAPAEATIMEDIQNKLRRLKGKRQWLKNIDQDSRWDDLLFRLKKFGAFFNAGTLQSCYLNSGEPTDFILLPEKESLIISVDAKCPRERILQLLSE